MSTPEGGSRTAIVRLLSLMRDGKEVRQYLQRFSQIDQARFAVIKVGGAILRDGLPTLADALAFLHTVGLTPVVVHGGGPQLDAALAKAGIPTERRDGLRVTTPDVMAVARDVFVAENLALVDAVRAAGASAVAIPFGVFEAELFDGGRLGLVGDPQRARLGLIESAAKIGAIPVLASLGVSADGQLLNVNADAAVRCLVTALQPYKIVFLTETGGVLDAEGKLIPAINLATDWEEFAGQPWLTGGMRLKLEEIRRLLALLPLTSSVSMTRPEGLAQELFTHGGSGTLVRQGEAIIAHDRKEALDAERVRALVTDAFGRPPSPDWWPGLALTRAFVTERYRAGAFVTELGGAAYLDKYAVRDEARGEGLGQAVWRRLVAEFPRLVWRARAANPINEFYFRESDGCARRGPWIVFWRGVDSFVEAGRLVDAAAARPATLLEKAA